MWPYCAVLENGGLPDGQDRKFILNVGVSLAITGVPSCGQAMLSTGG